MSDRSEFKSARMDKPPKGYARQLAKARKECSVCWSVGFHDPLCPKVNQTVAMRKRKETP
jgi:hypothetical protein